MHFTGAQSDRYLRHRGLLGATGGGQPGLPKSLITAGIWPERVRIELHTFINPRKIQGLMPILRNQGSKTPSRRSFSRARGAETLQNRARF